MIWEPVELAPISCRVIYNLIYLTTHGTPGAGGGAADELEDELLEELPLGPIYEVLTT